MRGTHVSLHGLSVERAREPSLVCAGPAQGACPCAPHACTPEHPSPRKRTCGWRHNPSASLHSAEHVPAGGRGLPHHPAAGGAPPAEPAAHHPEERHHPGQGRAQGDGTGDWDRDGDEFPAHRAAMPSPFCPRLGRVPWARSCSWVWGLSPGRVLRGDTPGAAGAGEGGPGEGWGTPHCLRHLLTAGQMGAQPRGRAAGGAHRPGESGRPGPCLPGVCGGTGPSREVCRGTGLSPRGLGGDRAASGHAAANQASAAVSLGRVTLGRCSVAACVSTTPRWL